MSNSWRQAYSDLTDFISEHSKVEIGVSIVSIPENVRPEFYQLFNAARTAFVEEKFPDLLGEARLLSENYIKAEQEVTKLLGLEGISASPSLHRFLHDPRDELIRGLFTPLFDLLKGEVAAATLKQEASKKIECSFRELYRSGYEKWVVLSLVKLLEADDNFEVTVPHASEEVGVTFPNLSKGEMFRSGREEPVIPLENSKHLSLEHEPLPTFAVPDFIVHSAKINRFVALRQEVVMVGWIADNVSMKREWYSRSAIREKYGLSAQNLDFMVIYLADKPKEISLVADAEKICRPDLIIECREQKDWYEKEGIKKVKLHHDVFKPRQGTYIVSMESVTEQISGEPALEGGSKKSVLEQQQEQILEGEFEKWRADIHILTVGFDQPKLEPIISALVNQESKQQ